MQLTDDQNRLLATFEDFLQSENRCLLVQGYAGTGKTFMIGLFVAMLRERHQQACLLAPTGRAARVLSSKAKFPASTIHREIYNLDKLKEHDKEEARFKFYFELNKQSTDDLNQVFIVDEASLVSDRSSEQEFLRFGSGRLLSDLVECLRLQDPTQPSKVIFVGDPAQLPPVNESISPALDAAYLLQHHSLDSEICQLTQVVRQAEGSAILKAATRIREDILTKRQNTCVIDPVSEQIESIAPADASRIAAEMGAEKLLGRYVIVTYANATALHYNQMVRRQLFGCEETAPPRENDVLMVAQNNRHHGVLNGDMVLVEGADANVETRHAPVGKENVSLRFRNVLVRIPQEDGMFKSQNCKILENVLYNKLRDITPEEQKALYVDFCIRRKELRPGSAAFTEAILDDPYFNALRVKFGYAITCHKAQGGEWDEVAVVFENNRSDTDALRWIYTAITRAQTKLYGINLPSIRPWDNILPQPSQQSALPSEETQRDEEVEDIFAEDDIFSTDSPHEETPLDAGEIPFFQEFPETPPFLRQKHQEVMVAFAEQGIQVDAVDVRVNQYFFRYSICRGSAKANIQTYFSQRGIFRPQILPGAELDDDLANLAVQMISRPLGTHSESQEDTKIQFPEDRPYLKEFYHQAISPLLIKHNIRLIKLEHQGFRERYWFEDDTGSAVVDYVYNKKGKFTYLDVITTQSTSPSLIEFFNRTN